MTHPSHPNLEKAYFLECNELCPQDFNQGDRSNVKVTIKRKLEVNIKLKVKVNVNIKVKVNSREKPW